MKSILSIQRLAGWAIASALVLTLADSALAQGGTQTAPPPGAGPPGIISAKRADQGRQIQEGRLRSAEMDATAESENERHIKAAIVHMKEDFTRIQVLRNDIARNLVAHKPLDYDLVSLQTGEINRRANDLNIYMLAHVPDENNEADHIVELQPEEMIGALVKLCKLIDSFTENPTLKNAASVDVKQIDKAKEDKARADKDLLSIIKFSGSIKKKSDSLRSGQ